MKRSLGPVSLLQVSALSSGICEGQTLPPGQYFGQAPPGFTPVVFAPDVVSLPNRYEYCVCDVLGREVRSLVNAPLQSGTHSVAFDALSGDRLAGGVYYYSLHVGDRLIQRAKMMSLR